MLYRLSLIEVQKPPHIDNHSLRSPATLTPPNIKATDRAIAFWSSGVLNRFVGGVGSQTPDPMLSGLDTPPAKAPKDWSTPRRCRDANAGAQGYVEAITGRLPRDEIHRLDANAKPAKTGPNEIRFFLRTLIAATSPLTVMSQILVSRKQSRNSYKQRQMNFLMDLSKWSADPTPISKQHCITLSDLDGWNSSEP